MTEIRKALGQLEEEIKTLEARQAVSKKALEHLREIYKTAWIEANYDPFNQKSQEAAAKIWPHIQALNEELGFVK